jgi:hypothetical protein
MKEFLIAFIFFVAGTFYGAYETMDVYRDYEDWKSKMCYDVPFEAWVKFNDFELSSNCKSI